MVLDLDGDGIETTSTRDGTVILFDHDADGVKTGTGWVKPDDGWLVLDRNGNGTIDSGRELFGVDTLKSNGQLATDGFDALKDLDANQDGKIDSADSVFANLRIWRDLNQDGISQDNELTTLAANSITGIGVNSSAVRTDLGNGNVQTAAGTFTRSNGNNGTTGETNGAAANLDLLVNTFYRQFTDHIALTDQAKALPTLRGSGRVRDLNEAVSLSTDLGNWLQTYTQQTTRQGQIDKLDGFIEKWANTADLKSLKSQADALTGSGVKLTYNMAGLTAGTPAYDDFVRKLGMVERFMGFTYGGANGQARFTPLDATSGNLTVSLTAEQIASISVAYDRFKTDIYESLLLDTRLKPFYDKIEVSFVAAKPVYSFVKLEAAFVQSIQTNAQQGIVDLVEFFSAFGEWKLNKLGWTATDFLFTQLNAAPDLGAFSEELSSWTVRLAASTEHNLAGTSRPDLLVGTAGMDYLYGRDGNDILLGKGGDDVIDGGAGSDTIDGGAGDDIITDLAGGTNVLRGGDGNDTVTSSYYASNTVEGGTGDDLIKVDYNQYGLATYVNTFTGGKGNDRIQSGGSTDTYVYNRGDGSDTINDYGYNSSGTVGVDKVVFGAGITASNLSGVRLANGSLVLKINDPNNAGAADQITIENWYSDARYQIESFVFSDGTSLNSPTIVQRVVNLFGTSGNDSLIGNANDNLLDGGAGADAMTGGAGNDIYFVDNASDVTTEAVDEGVDSVNSTVTWTLGTNLENLTLLGSATINGTGNALVNMLTGNAANNVLTAGAGDDTLDGGAGADTLIGGAGNDKYVLGRGYGAELVQEIDTTAGNIDAMQFVSGVSADQIWFRQIGDDLEVSIIGTADKANVQNWYLGSQYHVEQFKTSDGRTLLDSKVQDLVSAMAAFVPPAVGQTTLPTAYQTTLLPVFAADWGP